MNPRMFHLVKAAPPQLGKGASIITSSSVNSDLPSVSVLLAGHEASYVCGARVAVTGGRPIR
jgi:hypothetical protein